MEKVKNLIRFYQIHYSSKGNLGEYQIKRFLEFCRKGEQDWCLANLSSNDFYHLNLRDEERKRRRFESIEAIRGKSLHEIDFTEFSHDEQKWMELEGVSKDEKERFEMAQICHLIHDLKTFFWMIISLK